jgi:hypothetical protein
VDGGDVGVVQRREKMGFALEPREAFGNRGQLFREEFDRDFAMELGVPGAVNVPHPARAQRGQDFVSSESAPGSERHQLPSLATSASGLYGSLDGGATG